MTLPNTALIVDDVSDMRSLLRTTLLDLGVKAVEEAADGAQALAIYQQSAIDIVFLDINMPGVSGLELLQELMRLNEQAHVVMVSGDSSITNVKTSIGLGAKGFVVKPYSVDKIQEALNRYPSA
ncbi:hypothetical protein A9Q99_02900 [Gammaproteobacteria bacterium 45_16_T64]|nr:hypothetical protein A9Q99_02900 [Gammaproteobacteria bacterium 45_16_T64]